MKNSSKNVVLIGMCGVGKSTVGVLVAKLMARCFLDTDVYIQAIESKSLQQIIDDIGLEAFCRLEESHILCLDLHNAVIATGGSVVYSQKAMAHLAASGIIVHLELPFDQVLARVTNLDSRGIVKSKDQSLRDLYSERMPLYRRFAQVTIDCSGKSHDQLAAEIVDAVS